jgi:anti-sigma B factor antagonist
MAANQAMKSPETPRPGGSAGSLDVLVERQVDDETIIRCSGELDLATSPRLEEAVEQAGTSRITIDCSKVTFIDSSGVRLLLRAALHLDRGGVAWEIVPSEALLRVAAVLGVRDPLRLGPQPG